MSECSGFRVQALWVCVCVCVCVFLRLWVFAFCYISRYIYIYTYICISIYIYVYTYIQTFIYVFFFWGGRGWLKVVNVYGPSKADWYRDPEKGSNGPFVLLPYYASTIYVYTPKPHPLTNSETA